MNIYFHIDELARDSIVASALRKECKKRGIHLTYGNRYASFALLKHYNVFDVIILPSLIHYMDAFPDPENLPDNVFILQTEAVGQATGTLRRLNAKYFGDDQVLSEPWHKSVAGFLLWGHAHVNPFLEFYPSYMQKSTVVGHPRLSKSCDRALQKKQSSRPKVGFISRFNLLSVFDNRTPFESIYYGMKFGDVPIPKFENSPDKDIEDCFFTESLDCKILLHLLRTINTDRFELCVRPHPRENREYWMKLRKHTGLKFTVAQWDEPFAHWIQSLDYVITPPSTSIYDCIFHGIKPIVTDRIFPRRADHILTESDDNNEILNAVCRPDSFDDILKLLETGEIDVDELAAEKVLYEQVGSDIAAHSITNILNTLEAHLSNQDAPRNSSPVKKWIFNLRLLIRAYLKCTHNLIMLRKEQGSDFSLTYGRQRWITKLTT